MLTATELTIVRWLRREKVATMAQLQGRFSVSHMTVVRTSSYDSCSASAGCRSARLLSSVTSWPASRM